MSSALPQPNPGTIGVASFAQANRHKRKWDAILTCEDPRERQRLRLNDRPQLVLPFEDCDDLSLGYAVATRDQVQSALEFGRDNAGSSLLVHCLHGVGRSAAVALAILADRLGAGREDEAVSTLLEPRPESTPNLVAVELADSLLGRGGALMGALQRSEDANPQKLRARKTRAQFARENPHLYAKA